MDEKLEELQSDLPTSQLSKLQKIMDNAESCESREDFVANVREAMDMTLELISELKWVLRESGGSVLHRIKKD
jgi:uncharacterized protein YlzI (FlbEa/FlbD family)